MARKDQVKKLWDEATEAWSDFIRTGKDYFRDYLNNPVAFKLIGNIEGKHVLDLACGEGYNTRILAKKGAKVTGIDISPRMIELGKQEESKENSGITYLVRDAANLKNMPSNSFDLITCFMGLQDIEHISKATAEGARVLKSGGRFIFSIPHPCFERITKDDRTIRAYEDYFDNVRYEITWNMERLDKHFKTVTFHRTLTAYFQALHKAGFYVSRLIEPKASLTAVSKHPEHFAQHLKIPQSVIIEAVKPEEPTSSNSRKGFQTSVQSQD